MVTAIAVGMLVFALGSVCCFWIADVEDARGEADLEEWLDELSADRWAS